MKWQLFVGVGLSGFFCGWTRAEMVEDMAWSEEAGQQVLSWTAVSVSRSQPYHFSEIQPQVSADLLAWEDFGAPLTVTAAVEARVRQSLEVDPADATMEGKRFFRLALRFRGAGRDFSSSDFSRADLRGADLADADFSGADLSGANLMGADLEGTLLDSALLTEAHFYPASPGAYEISVLGGEPLASVGDAIPDLPFVALEEDFVDDLPGYEDLPVSSRNLVLWLSEEMMLAEFNELLAAHGAMVAGSIGELTAGVREPLVVLRFAEGSDLGAVETALSAEPKVLGVMRDFSQEERLLPDLMRGASPAAPNWVWNSTSFPDGNWGMEWARIPQMWNLNDGIDRLAKMRGGRASDHLTFVIDGGYDLSHPELANARYVPGNTLYLSDHGTHVAGTVGAAFDDGGMEGVDPYVRLRLFSYYRPFTFFSQLKDIAWLAFHHQPRVVNCSYGLAWCKKTASGMITCTDPDSRPDVKTSIGLWSRWAQGMFSGLRLAGTAPLVVVAAGNDSVDAQWAGALERLARVIGSDDIIIVGAQDVVSDDLNTDFSNTNVEVLAPGTNVLSAVSASADPMIWSPTGGFGWGRGTSMAAPHVSGLASYLLQLNPNLDNRQLKNLLSKGAPVGVPAPGVVVGTPGPIDGFHSALLMDTVAPPEMPVLKMLLDIDDGTPDGNLRVEMPGIERPELDLSRDRSFAEADGDINDDEDFDGDGGLGDGVIDMADFRRWRDWWLFGLKLALPTNENSLDGATSKKNDADRDGKIDTGNEILTYPRSDFNGNGQVFPILPAPVEVPGLMEGEGPLEDLNLFAKSGFWAEDSVDPAKLPDLLYSVDVVVSAETLLNVKFPQLGSGMVTLYDAGTDDPVDAVEPVELTADEPVHIFTVPTAYEYYVASEPIEIEDDEGDPRKVQMRSIGSMDFPDEKRGGDFLVDLAAVEMTGKVKAGTNLKLIESQPDEEEIEARIEALNGAEEEFGHESAGVEAYANEDGTFHAYTRTGTADGAQPDALGLVTFESRVVWQRSFIKEPEAGKFEFNVKPIRLHLIDGVANFIDLEAFSEIRAERRYYGGSADWETVFYSSAEIIGWSDGIGGNHTFRLVEEEFEAAEGAAGDQSGELEILEGEWPVGTAEDGGVITRTVYYGATYEKPAYEGTIPTDDIEDGDSFEVRYTLKARSYSAPADEYAEAFVGDPLDYGSGVTLAYGEFGEFFRITEVVETQDGALIRHRSKPGFYFVLCRAADGEPLSIKVATGREGEFEDPDAAAGVGMADYLLKSTPIRQPADTDGDGIDDIYELERSQFLDPLDPDDAAEDEDGDAFSNLAEYQRGSDPAVFDQNPDAGDPPPRYPGKLVEGGGNSHLHVLDLNQDEIPDLLTVGGNSGPGLTVSLANPDRSFQNAIATAIPDAQALLDMETGNIDGDGIPDVAVLDSVARVVRLFRGDGDGTFTEADSIDIVETSERMRLADVTGDGLDDVFVVLSNARRVILLENAGQGEWVSAGSFDVESRPLDVAAGFFNEDAAADLAISLANGRLGVYLAEQEGFSEPSFYEVGANPSRVTVGDVNGDGRDDLAVANKSGDDLSLLVALENGAFGQEMRYRVGETPQDVRILDLSGDAKADLLVSHGSSNFHVLYLGDGMGGFGPGVEIPSAASNANVVLADHDGDGNMDLFAGLPVGRTLVLRGLGGGAFDTRLQTPLGGASIKAAGFANLDADEALELIMLNAAGSSLDIHEHGLDGGVAKLLTSKSISAEATAFAVMDFDGNAMPDIVTASREPFFFGMGANRLEFVAGDGAGGLSSVGTLDLSGPPESLIPASLGGEPQKDLVVTMPYDDVFTEPLESRIAVVVNDGSGSYSEAFLIEPPSPFTTVTTWDLEGDGTDEILVALGDPATPRILVYQKQVDATWVVVDTEDVARPLTFFLHCDVVGDAGVELVAVTTPSLEGKTQVMYFAPTSGLISHPVAWFEVDGVVRDIAFEDLEGDGDLDAVVNGDRLLLFDAAQDRFVERRIYTGGTKVFVSDFNGDDRPDIAAWNTSFSDFVAWLLQKE